MSYVEWPDALKIHADVLPYIVDNVRLSGRTLTGAERRVANDAGYWAYSITTAMWTPQQVRAFRAMFAATEGSLGAIRVPFWDRANDLASLNGYDAARLADLAGPGTPFGDGAFFSDGAGWASSWGSAPVMADAALRATRITVTMPLGMVPDAGILFSTGTRVYEIISVARVSGNIWTLRFRTPLREPIVAGATIRFDDLRCLMKLASGDLLRVERDPVLVERPVLEFVETIL